MEQQKAKETRTSDRDDRSAERNPAMAVVTLKKCGDEGADAGLLDLYQSLGYQVKSQSTGGSIEMEMPRDKALAVAQAAIDEHYRRVKGAQRASVGPDVNLVEDRTETFTPKSAEDLIGKLGLDEEA